MLLLLMLQLGVTTSISMSSTTIPDVTTSSDSLAQYDVAVTSRRHSGTQRRRTSYDCDMTATEQTRLADDPAISRRHSVRSAHTPAIRRILNNDGFICIAARTLDYTIPATHDSAYNRTQIIIST